MDLNALLVDLAASPWMPLLVLVVCIVDGFFPPIPSETTVVAALAVVLAAGDVPAAGVILFAAAAGAALGDSIAYAIGRSVGLGRFAWMRRERVRRVTAVMRERVHRSPAMLLLVARYIPVGRVAVNATAGATGLPYRRFLPLSALAGTAWAGMCLAVAGASAAWLGEPLWASLAAVGIMLTIGVALDVLSRRRLARSAGAEHGVRRSVTPARTAG